MLDSQCGLGQVRTGTDGSRMMIRPDNANSEFEFGGINHVALVCADMAKTVDFYSGVLGMPLVKSLDLPGGMGQHFFFDAGNGDCVAFFWFATRHRTACRASRRPRPSPASARSPAGSGPSTTWPSTCPPRSSTSIESA